jgi:DNA-binding GntR family transcriptional regulator
VLPPARHTAYASLEQTAGGKGETVRTRRERVHTALREQILRRELVPGQRLVERELAAALGVSRTPVRECLLLLQMEGLADTFPGLGVVVREINCREVREALAVRGALDALAAQEACRKRNDDDLLLIEAALRSHELALQSPDSTRIALADSQFHARIYEAAHNGVLMTVRRGFALYEGFYFHGDFYRYTPEAFAQSLKRHRQILRAIAQRNAAAAGRAADRHIQDAAELVHDGRPEARATTPGTSGPPRRRQSRPSRASVTD